MDIFQHKAHRLGGNAHEHYDTEWLHMVIESVCLSIQLWERGLADKVAVTQPSLTPKSIPPGAAWKKSNTKSVCAVLYMHLPSDFIRPERFMKALRLLLGTKSLGTWWWWCKSVRSDGAEQQNWREGESRLSQHSISAFRGEEEVGSWFWQCGMPCEICYHVADSMVLLCIPRVWACTNAPS